VKRRTRKTLTITADRAAHVLHILIADGKLTAKHVSDALKRREQLIHDLRLRLAALEQGTVSAVERTRTKIARKVGRKAKRRMSPARRAALKLHGRYLGHVRTLSKGARAKVKAIREKSGVQTAIEAATGDGETGCTPNATATWGSRWTARLPEFATAKAG